MAKHDVVTKTLNGSEVVIYPMRDVRSIHIECWVKAGSWYEDSPHWGRFHLLEHTMHDATKKFPNRLSMEYFEEEHGITSNAWTGQKSMGFWVHFPENSIDEGFELLQETVFNPLLPQQELTREVGVIQQEYKDRWSNPGFRFSRAVDSQLYGTNHLYSRDAQGDPDFMKELTHGDMKELYDTYFQPVNMNFVVVGRIDSEKAVEKLTHMLGTKDAGQKSPELVYNPITSADPYLFHKEDTKSVTLVASWLTKGKKDHSLQERLAAGMAMYLLGGSPRSLLYKRLRHELGIVYSVSARRSYFETVGTILISTSINSEYAQKVLDEIRSVVQEFLKSPPTKQDFDRAANFMHTRWLMAYDSINSIADDLITPLFHDGMVLTPEDYIEVAKQITPEQLLEIVREPLSQKEFISVMAPEDPQLK